MKPLAEYVRRYIEAFRHETFAAHDEERLITLMSHCAESGFYVGAASAIHVIHERMKSMHISEAMDSVMAECGGWAAIEKARAGWIND